MDKELKVLLNIISQYLTTEDCGEVEFDFDPYSMNCTSGSRVYCNGKQISLPLDITKPLERFMDSIEGELDQEIGDSEVYNYTVRLNPEDRSLTVIASYTVYGTDGPYENEEIAIEACEQFIEDGYSGVLIFDFNGGGDSGYVEDDGISRDSDEKVKLNKKAEEVCYSLLGNFGGWEINEGSSGQIFFDLDTKNATLEFTWNTEEAGEEEQGVWKF